MEQLESKCSREKQDWERKERKREERGVRETNAKIKILEHEKQCFIDKLNQDLRIQIKELRNTSKKLKKDNKELTKINEHGTSDNENLKAERDKFSSDIERLRNEVGESQLKCRT